MKHVTWAHNPLDNRLWATGGDYSGGSFFPGTQSYRQETWSLSLAERWANRADRNAGWRLEYPYCGPADQVQPKHPDFVGWTWDPRRKVFWMVPGVMEIGAGSNCPGETADRRSDPGFLLNTMMTFDPVTKIWTDQTPNGYTIGPDAIDTWMSVYDPVRDEITRFGFDGAHGGVANILDLTSRRWSVVELGSGPGAEVRIRNEYLAPDLARREIYAMDGSAGRLYRWSMDRRSLTDLGPIPGGTMGTVNQTHPVWDSVNNVLLWHRTGANTFHVYHPDLRRWESPPIVTSPPGLPLLARSAVFDPANNVLLLMGSVEPPNPYMFLYRYEPPASAPGPRTRRGG